MDSEGNLHVLCFVDDEDGEQLWYRKVSPTGEALAGPLEVGPEDAASPFHGATIVTGPQDKVHIAYSIQVATMYFDLFYVQLSIDGMVTVEARKVHTSDTESWDPDIDTDPSGNVYIVWREWTESPSVYWIKLSPAGEVVSDGRPISGQDGSQVEVMDPRLGVDDDGFSHVVWFQREFRISMMALWFVHLGPSGDIHSGPHEIASNLVMSDLAADIDNGSATLHILLKEQDELRYIEYDQGVVHETMLVQPRLSQGQVISPDVSVNPYGDVYITYAFLENQLPSTQWHSFLWVVWESNGTLSGPLVVGSDVLPSLNPGVASGHLCTAVFFERDADMYLVTFQQATGVNRAPTASLRVHPTDVVVGQEVTFDGSDSHDPDEGDAVEEYWFDWGDGNVSGWTSSPTTTHEYSTSGTFEARLRVRDTHGLECKDYDTVAITVSEVQPNKAPIAHVSADPTSTRVGETVLIDGSGSKDEDGFVVEYKFEYGDGSSSGWIRRSTTDHSYSWAASFTISLSVKDDRGAVSGIPAQTVVQVKETHNRPTGVIESIAPNPAETGDEVTFTGSGHDPDGVITDYQWESNLDGVLSHEASFKTSDLRAGSHLITFTVMNGYGIWSEPSQELLVVKWNRPFEIVVMTDREKADTNTEIEFLASYIDPEGDEPTSAMLHYGMDGHYQTALLVELDTSDSDFTDGKDYIFTTRLRQPGTYEYFFEFTNARNGRNTSEVRFLRIEEVGVSLPSAGTPYVLVSMATAYLVAVWAGRRTIGGDASLRIRCFRDV